jgi:hypothetical protein
MAKRGSVTALSRRTQRKHEEHEDLLGFDQLEGLSAHGATANSMGRSWHVFPKRKCFISPFILCVLRVSFVFFVLKPPSDPRSLLELYPLDRRSRYRGDVISGGETALGDIVDILGSEGVDDLRVAGDVIIAEVEQLHLADCAQ